MTTEPQAPRIEPEAAQLDELRRFAASTSTSPEAAR